MSVGAFVRSLFGPYERQISELYRSIFFDAEDFVRRVQTWQPDARAILEVGCGEGAVSERLARAFPHAEITGIDITPRVGRLYAGAPGRVRFLECTAEALAAAEPGRYDLVVLADVLHHVPEPVRRPLLDSIRRLLSPGGSLVFKDWEKKPTPIHWLCYASDRWLTGDRIRYMSRGEAHAYLAASFGQNAIRAEARTLPWSHNMAALVRP